MAENTAATAPFPISMEAFSRLAPRQKVIGMVGVALLLAVLIGGWLWTKDPPYSLLFAIQDEKDGGQIVAALSQQNIPYRFSDGGRSILVPQAVVHDTRLKLASQGLPKGGLVGIKGGWLTGSPLMYPSEMAQNFWTAIYAWTTCFVATIVISLVTRRLKSDQELTGLVYSLTPKQKEHGLPWWKRPVRVPTWCSARS